MSFLKQNLDFLIEEPYDLEFKPLGYLTIVVVAVLAFFVFVPKGDKKLSPASEITTDKAVEMRGVIGGDDRIIAHIPAGSALKIYATIGEDELWAEDIHGNRGAVPVSLLGDRYFLLDDEKLGETMYKKGTEVTLLEKVDEFHYKVRTDDGTVGETNYPGRIIFNAGALGLPDKHRNTYHIAFTKFMDTFQAGKPMDEIEGHPLYAESIKNEGGRLIADYEYAVFSDKADSVYVGVRAVFADGVLESVETGTVKTKPYTVALRILPFTEALMGLPVIRDLSWHKPVAKTYAESQKDIAKSINIDNIKPRFISVILKIIILVLLLGLLIYTVIDLLLFVPMLLYPPAVHPAGTQHLLPVAGLVHGLRIHGSAFRRFRPLHRRQQRRRHGQALVPDSAVCRQLLHRRKDDRLHQVQQVPCLRTHERTCDHRLPTHRYILYRHYYVQSDKDRRQRSGQREDQDRSLQDPLLQKLSEVPQMREGVCPFRISHQEDRHHVPQALATRKNLVNLRFDTQC